MRARLWMGALLVLVACGSGDGELAAPCEPLTTASTNTSQKPEITIPQTDPPEDLTTCDVVEGFGDEAATGDEVLVQYVGVAWSTGEEFDATWDRPREPFSLQLGAGHAPVSGIELGLVGAKEGGRRELIIPPHLGYKAEGRPPDVGPNETLVFVIDVIQVGGEPRP